MRELSLKEIQEIELEILKDFDLFCRKNNLVYMLDGGTLIGAIREKGFIPWDDDIDVFMPREDYERFCETYISEKGYRVVTYKNEESYYYPFAKVINPDTVFYENAEKYGLKTLDCLGVYIDIFPLDYIPENPEEQNALIKKKSRLLWMELLQSAYLPDRKKYGIKGLLMRILFHLRGFRTKSDYLDEYARIHRCVGQSSLVYDSWVDGIWQASWFSSQIEVSFEGQKFFAPSGYHEFLTDLVGDYMTPVVTEPDGHGKAYAKE